MLDSDSSDKDLMRSLKGGDTHCLEILIERWEKRLLHFIFRYVQDESLARDILQETFVRIYQSRSRYKDKHPFSTWMFAIAANLCRNHHRWSKRHAETRLSTVPEPVAEDDPAKNADKEERNRKLTEAVRQLPHGLRLALLLYYYEDFSYKQIAEVAGCSVRGVEARLYRARKLLAEKLGLSRREISSASVDQRQAASSNRPV